MDSYVVRSGQGDPVILIHGLGGNLQSWDSVTARLETRFSVLRYDLRGHGKSHNPPGPWTLDDFVEDLETIVDHFGLSTVRLAGFSLGGLIAQGFTLKHPGSVAKLVILSAVAGRTDAGSAAVRTTKLRRGIGDCACA